MHEPKETARPHSSFRSTAGLTRSHGKPLVKADGGMYVLHRRDVSMELRLASHRAGFTLAEVLIFSAIFAAIMITFIAIFVVVAGMFSRQSASAEVAGQSEFLLRQIERAVARSSLIEMPQDVPTSTLKLRMALSSEDPTYIYLASGTMHIKKTESGAPQPLTSSRVLVSNVNFTKRSNAPSHDSVSVSFVVSYNTSGPLGGFIQQFRTAVARVSAATFDSNLIPSSTATWGIGTTNLAWNSINDLIYFSGARIGIGTAAPSSTLHVVGTSTISAALIVGTSTPLASALLTIATTSPIFVVRDNGFLTVATGTTSPFTKQLTLNVGGNSYFEGGLFAKGGDCDINLSGSCTTADLPLMTRYIRDLQDFNAEQLLHADVNGDNILNGIDVAAARQRILGITTTTEAMQAMAKELQSRMVFINISANNTKRTNISLGGITSTLPIANLHVSTDNFLDNIPAFLVTQDAGGANFSNLFTVGANKNIGIGTDSSTSTPHSLLTVAGLPPKSNTSTLVLMGSNTLQGANALGTFLGANPTSTFNGDFVNFQVNSNTAFSVSAAGTIFTNGNIGIGTTGPTQRIEVNGGLRLNTSLAPPACDAATGRGTLWFTQGGAGVADMLSLCMKDAAGAYSWKQFSSNGGL